MACCSPAASPFTHGSRAVRRPLGRAHSLVDFETPWGPLEMHTTHIPPGVTNGWIKIEMLEGLYRGLAHPSTTPRFLCGDVNTPQLERSTGKVLTWGQRLNYKGMAVIRQHLRGGEGLRWDQGERQVLQGLAIYDLSEVFRRLHGYATSAYSWYPSARIPTAEPSDRPPV